MKKLKVVGKGDRTSQCPYPDKGWLENIYICDTLCRSCFYYNGRFKNERAIQCSFDEREGIHKIKKFNLKIENNFLLLEKKIII
jgi:hypothetical protein